MKPPVFAHVTQKRTILGRYVKPEELHPLHRRNRAYPQPLPEGKGVGEAPVFGQNSMSYASKLNAL